ncbi:MAG: porin family protein [Bacteroidia bacterium]|nr:porin family protein [Bacteroidia bacterium]
MRWLLSILCLVFTSISSFSQVIPEARSRRLPNLPGYEYQQLHFGFLIGFNFLDYHIYNSGARTEDNKYVARYAEIEDLAPGINLGIITDLRLAKHLNLRVLPGVSFGERNLTFYNEYGEKVDDEPLRIKSTFIDMPIVLKYSAFRYNNVQPFVDAGISLKYDLAKDKQSHLQMKSFDTCLDFGAGIDFYLQYFRFSVELKSSFGLTNIHSFQVDADYDDRPYQQALSSLKSRIFSINFFFE